MTRAAFDLAFASFRYRIAPADARLAALLEDRYGAFASEPAPPASPRAFILDVDLGWGGAGEARTASSFSVSWENATTATVTSGVLAASLDLARRTARVQIAEPGDDPARAALPGMAVENFLRIATAITAPGESALLVHSAALSLVDGRRAVLLHGPSGAGKSTAASLSRARNPAHLVLTDDLGVVVATPAGVMAYATPFWGDDRPGARPRRAFHLAGIFALHQAPEHRVVALAPLETAGDLIATVVFQGFMRRESVERVIDLADEVTRTVPGFRLSFRRDSGFWVPIEEALA